MLAEFVSAIGHLATEAQSDKFLTHALAPRKLWMQDVHGDVTPVEVPPPVRAHVLAGYDDLVQALLDTSLAPSPEVYMHGGKVVALLDRAERVSTITVNLLGSARFALCQALQRQPRAMQPKDIVKMLRLELHSTNVDHVIQAMSRVDFTRTSAGKTDVAYGRESLGRSIEAAVQQADAVPRTFTVTVPGWTNPGFSRYSVPIEFGVHLDLEAQVIELRVLSDECERVTNLLLETAAKDLREALAERKVPVFLGMP